MRLHPLSVLLFALLLWVACCPILPGSYLP